MECLNILSLVRRCKFHFFFESSCQVNSFLFYFQLNILCRSTDKPFDMKALMITFIFSFTLFAKTAGVRKVSFIIDDYGIYPESISAFAGEVLEVYVTSTSKKSCLMIEGYDLFIAAKKGIVSEGKVTLNDSGSFKVYCPSDNYKAKVSVLPNKQQRAIASSRVDRPTVWTPKDYSE